MSDPIRIPLPDSIRLRLNDLHAQRAQIERDTKTIVDTVLGTQWGPGDPLWGASVALDTTHIIVTPPESPAPSPSVPPLKVAD